MSVQLSTIGSTEYNNQLRITPPKLTTLPFYKQVAKGQLEKPLATTALKFDIRDNTFAEQLVVKKKLTRPIIGLHFLTAQTVQSVILLMVSLIFPTWWFKSKGLRAKQVPNPSVSSPATPWQYRPWEPKQSQPLLITHQNGTQQIQWHHWKISGKQYVCWFPTQCQK